MKRRFLAFLVSLFLVSSTAVGAGETAFAKRLAPDEIEAIAVFMKLNPVNAFLQPKPYLLLKNGVICDCVSTAIEDIDLAEVRAADPGDLGEWRRRADGKFEVKWSDDTEWKKKIGGATARPRPAGWRLEGYFEATSGAPAIAGFHAGTWSGYRFKRDGTFETGRGGAVSMSGAPQGARGAVASETSEKGTYEIEGYSLTLRFDDGQTARTPFYIDKVYGEELFREGGEGAPVWIGGSLFLNKN